MIRVLGISVIRTLLFFFVLSVWSIPDWVDAQEQSVSLNAGGGVSIPVGDSSDGAATGWGLNAGFSVPITANVHAFAEGYHSGLGIEDDLKAALTLIGADAAISMTGANIGILLKSNPSPVVMYARGGIGYGRATGVVSVLGLDVSITGSGFAFTLGTGIEIPVGETVSITGDIRYNHILGALENEYGFEDDPVQWIPIRVGVAFTPN